ncbi:hypothetical protein H0H92_007678 [Tricholoma furcatifolium]|nr:hypothetical protein H0H92_007678 [Tricholoma furcatifolium]
MPHINSLTCTSSNRSLPSVNSILSAASATIGATKKALSTLKKSVTSMVRPKKKSQPAANNGNADNGEESESESDEEELAHLQAMQHSPVYLFFKLKVNIVSEGTCKAHVFYCAAKRCKGIGSVRRYQDSKDKATTSNFKAHAIKCFGDNVVNAAFSKEVSSLPHDGSIFAAFACQGQQPVMVSH